MKRFRKFLPATQGCPVYGEVLSASTWRELAESAYDLSAGEDELDERRLASIVDLLKWANPEVTESSIAPGILVELPTFPGLMLAPDNGDPKPPPERDWGASGEITQPGFGNTLGTGTKNGLQCNTNTTTVKRYAPIESDDPITIGLRVVVTFAGTHTIEATVLTMGVAATVYEYCTQLQKKMRVNTHWPWKLFNRIETVCLNVPVQIHYAAVNPVPGGPAVEGTDEGHYDYSEGVGEPVCRVESTWGGADARRRANELAAETTADLNGGPPVPVAQEF